MFNYLNISPIAHCLGLDICQNFSSLCYLFDCTSLTSTRLDATSRYKHTPFLFIMAGTWIKIIYH